MKTIAIDLESPDDAVLKTAAGILADGGVVAFPTETFYGLLARVDRPEALERVHGLKGRKDAKPMPCIAEDFRMASRSFDPAPPGFEELARRFWPGPLTMIGKAALGLVGRATGGGRTIGVRVPGSPACRRLAGLAGDLIAATSANPSEAVSASSAGEVAEFFAEARDLILFDGGRLPPSLGSTVLDLTADPPNVVRRGDLPVEDIESVLGRSLSRILIRDDEKLQELVQGPLRILQKTAGFRYAIDALLLASFVEFTAGERIADIGSGTGVIPMILAGKGATQVIGIEIRPELVDMSQRSIAANGLHEHARIIRGDARRVHELFAPGSFDVVVSNPPYFPVGTGHLSPDDARATSRHELTLTLPELIASAGFLLKDRGRFYAIHLAAREREVLDLMKKGNLIPQRLRRVLPKEGDEPKFILVAGGKNGTGPMRIFEPLVLQDENAEYTAEVTRLIRG